MTARKIIGRFVALVALVALVFAVMAVAPAGAAPLGVNLDQCKNGSDGSLSPCQWINGDLNKQNSRWSEGDSVPFRLFIKGLAAGPHLIHINYDFTSGGEYAYDTLTTYDRSEVVDPALTPPSGYTLPGGPPMQFDIPSDPYFATDSGPGDTTYDPEADLLAGEPGGRRMTIFGGTITGIDPASIVHSGNPFANSTVDLVVGFTSNNSTVALLWGGHLSKGQGGWGADLGASAISGAPFHMRSQRLDNANANKNQDRSIQPPAIQPPAEADAGVTKTASSATVAPGGTASFTITVSAAGPGDSTDVTLTDTLPTGFTWTVGGADAGACSPTGSGIAGGTTVTCTFGTVAAGTSKVITISATPTTADCGTTISNSANITSSNDSNPGNNSAGPATITVVCPDASVSKTAGSATVAPGGTATYTITVSAASSADSTGVVLTDTLPTGFTWTVGGADAAACSPTGSGIAGGTTVTCTFGTVPAGTSKVITISATPTTADCGRVIQNTATITSTNDTNPNNNSAGPVSITVTCTPDASVGKQATQAVVTLGGTASYTITVSAGGVGDSQGVTLTDTLPAGLTWTVGGADAGACSPTGSGIAGGTTVTCSFGTITAGQTRTITLTATVPAGVCGTTINNTATITSTSDTNPNNNSAGPVPIAVECPDAQVSKTGPTSPINPGSVGTFTIVVTAGGSGSSTGVVLTDTLPAGLTWTVGGADAGACSPTGSGIAGGTTVTCTFGTMTQGSTRTITLSATTSAANCPSIPNTATVSSTNDTNTQNNTSSATINLNCQVNLAVSKTFCPTTVVSGGLVTYTLSYSNAGNIATSPQTLRDSVTGGTPVSASNGGTISGNTASWNIGVIPPAPQPGSSGTRTLVVLVTAPNGGNVHNEATLEDTATGTITATASPTDTPVTNAGAITHGSGYSIDVSVPTLDPPLPDPLVHEGDVGATTASAPSGQDDDAFTLAVPPLIPGPIPGTVEIELLPNTSHSEVNTAPDSVNSAFSHVETEVANADLLGGIIVADAVKGVSHSRAGIGASSYNSIGSLFERLVIDTDGNPLTPPDAFENVAPNTFVQIMDPLDPTTVLAEAILYEESGSVSNTGFSATTPGIFHAQHQLNMIHVTLLKPFGTLPQFAQIIVGHSQTDADYPSGLACGDPPDEVSAKAFTAFAQGFIPPDEIAEVQQGNAEISKYGGANDDHVDVVSLGTSGGVLSTTSANNTACGDLYDASACGGSGDGPYATSRAIVTGVDIMAGLVTADVLDVSSTSETDGGPTTTFGFTFVNLVVDGHSVTGDVSPNTSFTFNVDGNTVTVILNEQSSASGATSTEGTISAIHVIVRNAAAETIGELIVASAHSDAHVL
jgi:uncharacterized repeat protein (TIGR01451 family)